MFLFVVNFKRSQFYVGGSVEGEGVAIQNLPSAAHHLGPALCTLLTFYRANLQGIN